MISIIKLCLIILILSVNVEAQDWGAFVAAQPGNRPVAVEPQPIQQYQYRPSIQLENQIIKQKSLENQILERQIYKMPDWIDPHVPRYNNQQQPVMIIGD